MTTDAAARPRIADACICCGGRSLEKSPAILMPFVAHRVFGWQPVEIDDSWGLRTISNGHAYSICNSVSCLDCGMLFLDIRFSDREMDALYGGYRQAEYTALRNHYEPGYAERNDALNLGIGFIREIEAFLTPFLAFPVRVLDWGGDTGINTPFKTASTLFHVYDISGKPGVAGAVMIGRDTALRTGYDLIVCSNVLEHIPYPLDALSDIRELMSRDTVLYIEVPHEEIVRQNPEGTVLCRRKRHWHEHINFFGLEPLRRLLAAAGMEIIAVQDLDDPDAGHPRQLMLACRLA